MKAKIGLITLGVENLERSVAFYKAIGFPLSSTDGDDFAVFRLNDTCLALFSKSKLAEDARVSVGSGFGGITLAHNEPSKEAVDAAVREMVAAGARLQKAPQDTFWGGYSAYVADPDGYLWEIAWNPFTDFT